MPRKASTKATISRAREVFLTALAGTGQIEASARAAKIHKATAYNWRKSNPEFAQEWEDALLKAGDMLEDTAIDRAVKGTLKPVFQGGVKVGSVREYSDGLLALLLKAHKPDKFRERSEVQVSGTLELSSRLQKARERANGSS